MLPAEQQENGPHQIGERRGDEQRAEARARRGTLRRESQRVMADEHFVYLLEGSALASQQRVLLLAFAQQEIAAGDPVVGSDGSADVVDAPLIHIDPTLLDAPPCLALGLRETSSHD